MCVDMVMVVVMDDVVDVVVVDGVDVDVVELCVVECWVMCVMLCVVMMFGVFEDGLVVCVDVVMIVVRWVYVCVGVLEYDVDYCGV